MGFGNTGMITICVDEYNAGEIRGRMQGAGESEASQFHGVLQLVRMINDMLDSGEFPQSTMQLRRFGSKVAVPETTQAESKKEDISEPMLHKKLSGKEATFRVRVRFRQNASWQGTITWVETGREENFRSALEMMMLIDSSMEAKASTSSASDSDTHAVGL